MTLVRVKDSQHLVRDTESGAIINRDYNGLEEYNKKRNILMTQKSEINTMNGEIQSLKNDITEIKQLMLQLLDKK